MKDVVARQAASINDAREEVFTICKDGHVENVANKGTSYYPSIRDMDMKATCGGAPSVLLHTHGDSLAVQSSLDRATHGKMFKAVPDMKAGCTSGIDGVQCVLDNGKVKARKFSAREASAIRESTGLQSWKATSLFCDKSGGKYKCSVRETLDGEEKGVGDYAMISANGGSSWLGDPESDFEMHAPHGKVMTCHGVPGKGNTLACVVDEDHRSR